MCGIVGYGGFSQRLDLEKAIDSIKHRGPDGQGVKYFDKIALGNVRLAIIDLSLKGSQPMFNQDRSLCITFNGEIYNFLEIKKLLDKKYKFQSATDTEVILCAYQEWGYKCLEKLDGMFSFVLYDSRKKLLFGARDRLGQKPLKYYYDKGRFIFASEVKAILALLSFKPEIDKIAIDDFLTLQYVPSPRTGFKKIYKLPPAHYFVFKNGELTTHKYWSLDFTKKLDLSADEWSQLIYERIEKSVESHLISDVPVGALLSGGLDSSLIVALMVKNSKSRVNTFSIGFDDGRFDESDYAEKVSKIYHTKHHKFVVSSKFLKDNLGVLVDFYDEPLGDNSILPTMLVSELTSSKVKVALSGDGGDENFAGYDRYLYVQILSYLYRYPRQIKRVLGLISKSLYVMYPDKQTERAKRFTDSLNRNFYSGYINLNCFFTNESKLNLYTDSFKKDIKNNNTFEFYSKLYDPKIDLLDNALNFDINTYLPEDLLYKTDIASMAHGLELRAPFLDHKLLELTAAMPAHMKIKLGNKKRLLKKMVLEKNLLPKEIVLRPKQGFNIPQNVWFKGPLRDFIYSSILSSGMVGFIFDKTKLENYLNSYYKTRLNYDNNIFALLVLGMWYDRYIK